MNQQFSTYLYVLKKNYIIFYFKCPVVIIAMSLDIKYL